MFVYTTACVHSYVHACIYMRACVHACMYMYVYGVCVKYHIYVLEMYFFAHQCYMSEMMNSSNQSLLPQGIAGRHETIFGNMKEIYDFHNK